MGRIDRAPGNDIGSIFDELLRPRGESARHRRQISGCSGADIWTAEATISIYQLGFMTLSPVRNHCQLMVVTSLEHANVWGLPEGDNRV